MRWRHTAYWLFIYESFMCIPLKSLVTYLPRVPDDGRLRRQLGRAQILRGHHAVPRPPQAALRRRMHAPRHVFFSNLYGLFFPLRRYCFPCSRSSTGDACTGHACAAHRMNFLLSDQHKGKMVFFTSPLATVKLYSIQNGIEVKESSDDGTQVSPNFLVVCT